LDTRLKSAPKNLQLEARPISWSEFFIPKRHNLTWCELAELGAPKIGAQFLSYGSMLDFQLKKFIS